MNLSKFALYTVLFVVFCSCTKSNTEPDNPPTDPPTIKDNPSGMFYINVIGSFIKLDATTDSVYWKSQAAYWGGSAGNPMTFDSAGYFYHGNMVGMVAYNTSTGSQAWSFGWIAFSDAISYREPAFNDSLICITSPTSVWDHGSLYCKNKKTRATLWQKPIDSGYVDTSFNGIPVLYGDKVITMTRSQSNQKRLTAFSIQNGNRLWSVTVSNTMSAKLWLIDGKIYSAYGPDAVCFDAGTGQLLWQTNMNVSGAKRAYNFFEGDKLIVVKVLSNSNYKILQIQKDNGAISKTNDLVVPTTYEQTSPTQLVAPLGCCYGGNRLYITSFNTIDSLDVLSYDITNMSQQWKIRFAHSLFAGQAPALTDKYLVFPVNDQYNSANPYQSKMIFLDQSGKLVKKVPFSYRDIDGFIYIENGKYYQPPVSFK